MNMKSNHEKPLLRGEITPFPPKNKFPTVFVGDPFKAKVKFWSDEIFSNMNLEGKILEETFYVASAKLNQKPSSLEGEVTFIPLAESKAPVAIKGWPIVKLSGNSKEGEKLLYSQFVLTDQHLIDQLTVKKFISAAILIILIVAIIFGAKKAVGHFLQFLDHKRRYTFWQTLFNLAKERKDFEKIYSERMYWISFLPSQGSEVEEFFKLIRFYQYKKKWENEEQQAIEKCFKELRKVIFQGKNHGF